MDRFLTLLSCALIVFAAPLASGEPLAARVVPAADSPAVSVAANSGQTTAPTAAAPKITFSACHVDGPYIAMTYDDGPHIQNTPRLLDMLKQRGIKATFFLVGENVVQYPQIVKRIVAEGHEIANHSWSHPQLSKMTDAGVREELQKTHDAIVAACGVVPTIMRPPYGAFTARQQRWCHGEFGYQIILWDVDPLDWKIRSAAHVESEILKQTVAGSIVLSHDIHKTTVDAMPSTLDALMAKGFKFVTVSELILKDRPRTKPKPEANGSSPAVSAAEPPAAATPADPAK